MAATLEEYQAAARAIGCTVEQNTGGFISLRGPGGRDDWSPDWFDHDCFDLAIRACISFQRYRTSRHSEAVGVVPGSNKPIVERVNDAECGGDANEATRTAIFRVAVAMGRVMA